MRHQPADTAVIQVKVVPRSARNQMAGVHGGVVRIKLTAPPVEGRANKALRSFLADRLGLSMGNVEIVSGAGSRTKAVRVHGLSQAEVLRRLHGANGSVATQGRS